MPAPPPNLSSGRPWVPWGKVEHDETGRVIRSQTLLAHSRDVSAIFLALASVRGIARRLASLAGRTELDPVTIVRLAYLVYLHDAGKVNVGFQARHDRHAPVVGHIGPLAAIFGKKLDRSLAERARSALDGMRLEAWGEGVVTLLDAIFSHHGAPWNREQPGHLHARHWRATADGYDPFLALAELRADADAFFPSAHSSGIPTLPDAPAFVHFVAGLAQLADWIASSGWERAPSDEQRSAWAADRLRVIGLDPSPWREPLIASGLPSFDAVFQRLPYVHQVRAAELESPLVVLESETGSGKTEAALWRFARLFAADVVDGLYFALPTRTAAAQLHTRVARFAAGLWGINAPPVVLAVPGYLADDSRGALPTVPEPLNAPEGDTRQDSVWAAAHPKRYFSALVSVGTIDQALLAALRVKHAHMRGAALARHLLVVDEVHASDAYMRRLLTHLLRGHLAAGGHAMLLSATLGAEARHALVVEAAGGRTIDEPAPTLAEAVAAPYPLLSARSPVLRPMAIPRRGDDKRVAIELRELLDDGSGIAAAAVAAAREGAKVLVVRNTVDGAVAVQREVEHLAGEDDPVVFRAAGVKTLHHGRFAREDRRLLDAAVERAVGGERIPGGLVVVGTQTLEQSLDIDADFLITDLCPADVLLQRLGRLHRHARAAPGERPKGYSDPRAFVLVPAGGLEPFLSSRRPGGLRRHGLGHSITEGVPHGVYVDLTILEATRRLIEERPRWSLPTMNRVLVERALHREAVDALISSMPDKKREQWREHRNRIDGKTVADSQIAQDGVVLRHRDFMDPSNVRFDRQLATRLDANDQLVDLPPGTIGPFGQIVRRISVPGWMVPALTPETPIQAYAGPGSGILALLLGDIQLLYDRHGLRLAKASS